MRGLGVVMVVAGLALAAGACGGGDSSTAIEFDSVVPAETTEAPTTTTSPAEPTTTATPPIPRAPWVPASANLTGIPSECGNLSYVTTRPDRDELIAGIAQRGLFASTDAAATWAPLGTARRSDPITNRTSAIVFDPEHPDTFWESGIYNGDGVYRTDDGGATFERLGDVAHSDLVSIDLTDPDRQTLLSGTHEQPVVYRSDDGGATWQDVSGSLPDGIGFASSPHVVDAQTHLLGTKTGPNAGVFRTTDGGVTWSLVHAGGVVGAPLVAGGTIWWLMENGGGVISSSDAGLTWTESPSGGAIYAYAASLIGLPDGRLATIGTEHVVVSADGGARWTPVGSPLPYPPNGLAYSPHHDAFYVWQFDCDFTTDNPIAPDAIMRLDGALNGG